MNDFWVEAKSRVLERISSPLLISFLISWCLINYDVLLTLASKESIFLRIWYVDTVLSLDKKRFLIPCGVAVAYTICYPFIVAVLEVVPVAAQTLSRWLQVVFFKRSSLLTKEERAVAFQEIEAKLKYIDEMQRSSFVMSGDDQVRFHENIVQNFIPNDISSSIQVNF